MAFLVTGTGKDRQRRTHRASLAIVTGIKHAFGRESKTTGHQVIFRFRRTLGRSSCLRFRFGFARFRRRLFHRQTEQFTAVFQLDEMGGCPTFGECIGRVVAVVPLTTLGESGAVVLQRGLAFEHV
ncbi:hypothetical protein D3C75_691460 [compost metagenome]